MPVPQLYVLILDTFKLCQLARCHLQFDFLYQRIMFYIRIQRLDDFFISLPYIKMKPFPEPFA